MAYYKLHEKSYFKNIYISHNPTTLCTFGGHFYVRTPASPTTLLQNTISFIIALPII